MYVQHILCSIITGICPLLRVTYKNVCAAYSLFYHYGYLSIIKGREQQMEFQDVAFASSLAVFLSVSFHFGIEFSKQLQMVMV